ncbi:ricin-type beta-trefoil lectin domain protein [Krasilnikovia sp. MM14-A1004]|uniref:ricin-type beta-trefoil lectin domain protein n=1 Tax=Krasilnikovia sp. MM14-A1004 TaxID=3373541 RepID=UPI00399D25AF
MKRTLIAAGLALAFLIPAPTAAVAAALPCSVQIVAHEDDDLLFMNPDLQRDIRADKCVRTVYVTAGDAGRDVGYWSARETGEQAAYATMAGRPNEWSPGTTTVEGRELRVSRLAGTQVELVFLRLPDGFDGRGSDRYGAQSLQKLWEGQIGRITGVDGTAGYTRAELISVLQGLLAQAGPDVVRLQDFRGDSGPVGVDGGDRDHHDHHAAAYFAYAAQRLLTTPHRTAAYRAYSISELPANVTGADLELKKATFYAYAAFDELLGCRDDASCDADPTAGGGPSVYRPWLSRQYEVPGPATDGTVELRAANTRCLDVRDAAAADGTPAQLWDCAGAANQRWTFTTDGALRGFADKCLDADPASSAVRIWACTGAAQQRWTLTGAGELRGPDDRCLDLRDADLPNGTPAELHACTGEPRQKWRVV